MKPDRMCNAILSRFCSKIEDMTFLRLQVVMTAIGVRRGKAAFSQWVKIPPGDMLQPEATGAIVEVTKRLKPPVKRAAKYGGSASVQAVTRVNAEQASKRTLHRPTRSPFRGRSGHLGVAERLVVLKKPGNAGGGKEPQFKTNA